MTTPQTRPRPRAAGSLVHTPGPVERTVPDYPVAWVEPVAEEQPTAVPGWLSRLDVRVGVSAGLALVAVGILLIVVAWSEAAGTAVVAKQVPYVLSGGFGGLALCVLGVLAVTTTLRLADLREQTEQAAETAALLAQLSAHLERRQ